MTNKSLGLIAGIMLVLIVGIVLYITYTGTSKSALKVTASPTTVSSDTNVLVSVTGGTPSGNGTENLTGPAGSYGPVSFTFDSSGSFQYDLSLYGNPVGTYSVSVTDITTGTTSNVVQITLSN